MKKLKTVSIVLFIAAVILFGGYIAKEKTTKDPTGPVITRDSENIAVSVRDGKEALLKGVTAADARDGDVTDSIYVETIGPMNEDGLRTVSYAAFDSDGHVSHALRTMSYTDYTPPVFHFDKHLVYTAGTTKLTDGITAQDCLGADLTGQVRALFDGSENVRLVGEYPARLRVYDSFGGCAEIPVVYEICNADVYRNLPAVVLTDYLLYVKKGENFDPYDYVDYKTIDGKKYKPVTEGGTYGSEEESNSDTEGTIDRNLIEMTGNLDTNTPGCYELIYSVNDEVNETGTGISRLYVVVTEGGARTDG